ncbi:FecR family protein [Sphingobacterium sp. LRF_L2]|uniref:FecR family protein n=1 Tax=Sphingobacterium sp. LRF_L2 TaxID=3369421 RepID=UPI003F63241F
MKKRIDYLIRQYIDNKATQAELTEFFNMIRSAKYDMELSAFIKQQYELLKREDRSAVFIDEEGKLSMAEKQYPKLERSIPIRKKFLKRSLSVAALCIAGLLLFFYYAADSGRDGIISTGEERVLKEAAHDERKMLQLSDGTKIWLNGSSKLEYPPHFVKGTPREVTLIGEAFFEVSKAADWPFIVNTGKLRTTVLGTAFNIKAYPEMANVMVSVSHGKVQVSQGQQILATLLKNQELRVPVADNPKVVAPVQLAEKNTGSWKEGYLDYEAETIGSVMADLRRIYQVDIELRDKELKDQVITASFSKEQGADQTLKVIASLIDRRLKRENGIYFIY